MFGKKKLDIPSAYGIYEECDKDFDKTCKRIVNEFKINLDFVTSIVQDAVLEHLPLKDIYCVDCERNLEKAIEQVMRSTSFSHAVCKTAFTKMIMESNLSANHYRQTHSQHNVVLCPKCGSQSITTTNKKISATRGIVGGTIGAVASVPGAIVGATVGGLTSKKIYNVCMNCGHRWKP